MGKANINRAEALRLADLQADKDEQKIISEWNKKIARAKTAQERERINATYGARAEKADQKGRKTYKAYYDYIHNNFSKNEIDTARKATGDFLKKSFLQKLFGTPAPKKTTAKPKATAKKATKPAPKKSTAKKTPAKGKAKTASKRKIK